MRIIVFLLLATAMATSARAQCSNCTEIEKKFTSACESFIAAVAELGERHPDKISNSDPKKLRASARDFCRCSFSKSEQMQSGDFEIFIEIYSMQEKTHKSLTAALSGDPAAHREYDLLTKQSVDFAPKAERMIGKDKLEKSGWLTQKFCLPMVEKFMGYLK